jgi:hypothetical protein
MTQLVILEGAPGFHTIQSLYAALRQLGLPVALANAVQTATALGVAVALVWMWQSTAAFEFKAAALRIGSPRNALWARLRRDGAGAGDRLFWPLADFATALRPGSSTCSQRCGCCRLLHDR